MDDDIAIAADHGGVELKDDLKLFLQELGYRIKDLGTHSAESVHYPRYGASVAGEISSGRINKGVLICGTGIGMSMVANRFPGVRAALCHDLYTAAMSRRHNDANCLVLGGRLLGRGLAREIVKIWLDTPFDGGRHQLRLSQIVDLEERLLEHKDR